MSNDFGVNIHPKTPTHTQGREIAPFYTLNLKQNFLNQKPFYSFSMALMQLEYIKEINKHALMIPITREEDVAMFNLRFGIRDAKRGIPKVPRQTMVQGRATFLYTTRELGEATGDSFTMHQLIKYLEKNTHKSTQRDYCLHDMDISDKFYTWAYVVNLQSGRGRWNYWQLYIPQLSTEEITDKLPKSIISQSKHNINPPPGYSPLLKLGEKTNFLNDFQKKINKGITQETYFLTKASMSELMLNANSYYEFINGETPVNNKDKQYFRFIKNWHQPIVLIDNNKDIAFGASLDDSIMNESYAHNQYPVFWPKYDLPDVKIWGKQQENRLAFMDLTEKLSFRGMPTNDQNELFELFTEMRSMAEQYTSGGLSFRPGNGVQELFSMNDEEN